MGSWLEFGGWHGLGWIWMIFMWGFIVLSVITLVTWLAVSALARSEPREKTVLETINGANRV